ncbi:MFS transporter [Actinoplanes sp. NBRC 101535]|uniref:MFS transporter n=1 Tax=Actinoplanes sp. NBRC 101535 TaxID=3032196 RepID=UPI0024A45972|nr:MFS transporter [Actinoplanes sp. NBRC 101535]GLY00010.1 hypothetical protein Acsp01_03890 [Actinoplanes sp. NBRC 101535]
MTQLNDLIAQFWRDYAALVLLGLGFLGLILLITLGIWAKRTSKPLRPLALSFSMNLALLLNAEGMWVIAVDQLNLPKVFAVLVFAVFEICFLTATSLAAEQYRRTTVYAEDGTVVTPGHPGPMLWIAAFIAGISGVIVASNAVTGTEKLLRLAVPCVIFLMWWAALTAAGQRVRRGRFAYSPRRLAERWGLLIPDSDPDLIKMASERQVRRMVVNYHRVSSERWPQSWWRSRLLKDARTAGEPVVADVVEQLARIQRVMDLLAPGATRFVAPVVAPAATSPVLPSAPADPPGGAAAPVAASLTAPVAASVLPSQPLNGHAVNGSANGRATNGVSVNGHTAAPAASAAPAPVAEGGRPLGFMPGATSPGVPAGPAAGGPGSAPVAALKPVQFVPPAGVDTEERPAEDRAPAVVVPAQRRPLEDGVLEALTNVMTAPSLGERLAATETFDENRAPSDDTQPAAVTPAAAPAASPPAFAAAPATVSAGSSVTAPVAATPVSAGATSPVGALPPAAGSVFAGTAPSPETPDTGAAPDAGPAPDAARPAWAATGTGAVPAWASTGTGARPAVSIVGSPWWRLSVERLNRLVSSEINAENLNEMTYTAVNEMVRSIAPRVSELSEGVVRAFINDYIRELNGEPGEAAYPWRDLLPAAAVASTGSSAWMSALEELRTALEEELAEGEPREARELAELLAPSVPRLDDVTVQAFISDYLLALGGQSAPGSAQPWHHLLPRPQNGRNATDDELLEVYGEQLDDHLRTTGRLSRYKVQAVTGIKSRLQADRIKAAVEQRAASTH